MSDIDDIIAGKEQCRACKVMFALDGIPGDPSRGPATKRGYIPTHYITEPWALNQQVECRGSRKRSLQFLERGRADRLHKHHRIVLAVKVDALVAYDAWQEDRYGFDYRRFVQIALDEYRIKFDQPNNGYPFVTLHRRRRDSTWVSEGVDVYCKFCRGLIITNTTKGKFEMTKVARHTTGCALQCLAGVREMMPPHHRGLIDEDMDVYATNDQMTLKETR